MQNVNFVYEEDIIILYTPRLPPTYLHLTVRRIYRSYDFAVVEWSGVGMVAMVAAVVVVVVVVVVVGFWQG